MDIRRYEKQDIARQQIETALALFFEGRDLFSVVTLAGSAEEILGELLRQRQGNGGAFRPLLDMLRPAARKNPPAGSPVAAEDDGVIHMDVGQEALFLLGRAIDDYLSLAGEQTPPMRRFDAEFRKK